MNGRYTIRKTAPRTARCTGCLAIRNRLAVYPEGCTVCLGHKAARALRVEIAHASALADLRAAQDDGTNEDIVRWAYALGYMVRVSGNRMEMFT